MRASPFVLAVAAVATTGFAPAAWAHVQPTAPARHCVVWIAPTTGRAPSKVSRMHCFRRFSRAVHVARGRPPKGFRTGVGFVERDVTVRLVVDATASMAHVDEAKNGGAVGKTP